ncbi:hypothetical protein [Sphingomonas sp. PR090111-T3T-6A]|nr:hypothetical protein [Sphingomonas sp. PR090111-T3T-6A]
MRHHSTTRTFVLGTAAALASGAVLFVVEVLAARAAALLILMDLR